MSAPVVQIPVVDEAQWLAARTQDVTSTEVPALYGLSPYVTEFELWHRKRDGVVVRVDQDERMRWGNRLESAIALGVAEDHKWKASKLATYMRLPDVRLGASFDFEIEDAQRGIGLLEVKNVDGYVFREQWDESGGVIKAPDHIELQLQTQLEVSGREWGCIVALVGGNEAHVTMRTRDPVIGNDIRSKVAAFWRSVWKGEEPQFNAERDAEFIAQLHKQSDACKTLVADRDTDELLADYAAAAEALREAETRREAAKARILMRIGTASKVSSALGTLSCGTTKESPGTLITPEMVGQHVGGRSSFRQFRFTPKKTKP